MGDDGREPPERRQPLALRRFALKARDRIGHRVERRGEQPRVFVLPARRRGKRNLAGQVPGRRHLAHRRGDDAERAGDRARDAVAQHRGGQHGDAGDQEHRRVQRLQERQPLGARAQDDRLCGGRRRPERTRAAARRCRLPATAARWSRCSRCRRAGPASTGRRAPGAVRAVATRSAAASTPGSVPPTPKAISLLVSSRKRPAARQFRLNPMLSVPRISGVSAGMMIQIGTETSCRMPPGWRDERAGLLAGDGAPDASDIVRPAARADRPGQAGQHAAVAVGHHEQVGGQLLLILLDDAAGALAESPRSTAAFSRGSRR